MQITEKNSGLRAENTVTAKGTSFTGCTVNSKSNNHIKLKPTSEIDAQTRT